VITLGGEEILLYVSLLQIVSFYTESLGGKETISLSEKLSLGGKENILEFPSRKKTYFTQNSGRVWWIPKNSKRQTSPPKLTIISHPSDPSSDQFGC